MPFYAVLENIMEEKSLSIPDVARMSGLSDSTVRAIIGRKSKNASLEVAFKIARGLDVSLERLNGEDENMLAKKEPPVENNRGEEDSEGYENRLHVLTRAFVKCGFMEEGGDISDSDLALIKGVLTILDAHFCDRDGGAC